MLNGRNRLRERRRLDEQHELRGHEGLRIQRLDGRLQSYGFVPVSVRKAIVTTLVLAGLVAAAFFAFARGGPRAAALRQKQSSHPASEASPATGEPDEVRRLRAEVKTKDNIIRAFATHALTSEADHEANVAATVAAAKRSQTDRAIEALDARIAAALPDVAAKTELEQALRPAFESAGFVGARVAEVRC